MSIYNSFYGNITNNSRSQFQFDKIYPNRREMDICCGRHYTIGTKSYAVTIDSSDNYFYYDDENVQHQIANSEKNNVFTGDGIFIGRYVLVEYDTWDDGSNGTSQDPVPEGQHFLENTFWNNYKIDQAVYDFKLAYDSSATYKAQNCAHGNRGYDSTVWQKVFDNGREQYIKIADLNSVTPTFEFYPLAPTASTGIVGGKFIKSADSTNVDYAILTPTPYQIDDHIDFDAGYIYKDDGTLVDNAILSSDIKYFDLEEPLDQDRLYTTYSASGRTYYGTDENHQYVLSTSSDQNDKIKYTASIPSLGKMASHIWDLIYPTSTSTSSSHYEAIFDTNTKAPAGSTSINGDIQRERSTVIGKGHGAFSTAGMSTAILNTVAGDINTYLDLIGSALTVRFSDGTTPVYDENNNAIPSKSDFVNDPVSTEWTEDSWGEETELKVKQNKDNFVYYNVIDGKYYIITAVLSEGETVYQAVPLDDFGSNNYTGLPDIMTLLANLYKFLYNSTGGYRSLGQLLELLNTYIDTIPKIEHEASEKQVRFINANSTWLFPEYVETHNFENPGEETANNILDFTFILEDDDNEATNSAMS